MNENHILIVEFRRPRIIRLRDGKHRRLAMEQLEHRWLLSAAAKATTWQETAPAAASATTWQETAPPAASANAWHTAAPAGATAPALPVAAPVAASATTSPAAASDTDCSGEGGWADVGPSGSGNGGGTDNQTTPASSTWSSSGADQLPAKKPGLLVLSPDELRANAAGEGGLADLTRISNQTSSNLLATTTPSDGATPDNRGGSALRPLSGAADAMESSGLSEVKLDGLRGTSQAFDVAVAPSSAGSATVQDPSAELEFRPATVWPMPMLPRAQSEASGLPTSPALPDAAPSPGEGKTTFIPGQTPDVSWIGPTAASANAQQLANASTSSSAAAGDGEDGPRIGKAHDQVIRHLADVVHDLSLAARLNDRRVDAAIVAVALAALPYRRFLKRHDEPM
jgi:hypothetical protein